MTRAGTGRALAVGLAVSALGAGAVSALAAGPRAGALDGAFGHRGLATLPAGTQLYGVAVQRDGKVVAVGATGLPKHARLLVARFTPRGTLDGSFGHRGLVTGPNVGSGRLRGSVGRAVAVEPDGTIVVVGKVSDPTGQSSAGLLVERYSARGGLIGGFGSHGVVDLLAKSFAAGNAVALAAHGTIVAAGSALAAGSGNGVYSRVALAELSPQGRPVARFGSHGASILDLGPDSTANAVATAPGGKLLIAGSESPNFQATVALVARVTGSGGLDRSFGGRGYFTHEYASGAAASSFSAVAAAPGGKLIAAGSAGLSGGRASAIVARFTGSGHPDGAFGRGGVATAPAAVGLLSSGTITPGASAVTLLRGQVLAAGTYQTGIATRLAVWAFTGRGGAAGGFGSRGASLLSLPAPSNSQGAAIAPGPRGTLVVAGSQYQIGGVTKGLVARFGG